MVRLFQWKKERQLERYFRCLSSICIDHESYRYYFTDHEFTFIRDGILGRRFFGKELGKWGIKEPWQIHTKVRWLIEQGDREECNRICNEHAVFSDAARRRTMQSLSLTNPEDRIPLIANSSVHATSYAGLDAYDWARSIYLCRIGRALGYLSKKEARGLMLETATFIQQSYHNWHEYFHAYFLGCFYFSSRSEEQLALADEKMRYIEALFHYPESAVYQIEWNHDLLDL
ncbi:DUF1266 domain-containing protein [Numidum massiliense]|uniref:DUF1266 domain-containing protein n=1 Tax=Numidum massiliense TaxID=1522315 RepID=UPI0006D5682E|nr:DUF1266 domain-containing protein [Numidum massiliense]